MMRDTDLVTMVLAMIGAIVVISTVTPLIMEGYAGYNLHPPLLENESLGCVDACILEGYRDGEIKVEKGVESCWCNDINKTPSSLRIR